VGVILTFSLFAQFSLLRVPQSLEAETRERAQRLPVFHSYRNDSIGSSRAAFHAGHNPKIMPMPTLAKNPAAARPKGYVRRHDQFHHQRSQPAKSQAHKTTKARQCHRFDQELPEDVFSACAEALRTPISRVRSVTDTSMIFITRCRPTISPTDEMATMAIATPPGDRVESINQIFGCFDTKLSGLPKGPAGVRVTYP